MPGQSKLYYFDGRGLAEPIRWILKIGGMEFEDFRNPIVGDKVPFPLDPEVKKKTHWGQVPLMEYEGRSLCQSNAIARFFAKKFGLVGKDDWDAALCDEYVDSAKELLMGFFPAFMEKDPAKREGLLAEAVVKMEEKYLSKFDEIIEANGGRHLVGGKLTWADLWLSHTLNNVELIAGVHLARGKFPSIQALYETVLSVPQVKEWIATRPKTML